MIYLKPMSSETFEKFKKVSQEHYAESLALSEDIAKATALAHASEQFKKLVSDGRKTSGHLFFDVIEKDSEQNIGYLWLYFKNRFDKKVAFINDIHIAGPLRGQGFGTALMALVEEEARKAQARRIELHVFAHNEIAKGLYQSLGFIFVNMDMRKEL